MRTKWLCLFAAVCLLVSLLGVTPVFTAAGTGAQIVVSDGEMSDTDSTLFTVTVSLENNPGLTMMRLKLNYDANNLQLVGVTDGGLLGTANHSSAYASNPYYLYWTNALAKNDYTANGVIATLQFKAIGKSGDYAVSVSANYGDVINAYEDEVSFAMVSGTIHVCDHKNSTTQVITKPTCTTDGKNRLVCADCGETSEVVVPKTGHKYGDWVTKEPTVKEEGYQKRTCSACGDVETIVLPKLEGTAVVEFGSETANGREVTVPITLSENVGISSLKLMLVYDPTYITFTGVTNGNVFSSVSTNGDELHFTNGGADATTDGILGYATFAFTDNVAAGQTVSVSADVIADGTFDDQGRDVNVATQAGNATASDADRYSVTVEQSVGGTVGTLPNFAYYGEVLTVTTTVNDGYTLAYWLVNDRYYKPSASFELPINCDVVIVPVYRSTSGDASNVYTLRFFTADGRLIDTMLSSEINSESDLPEVPDRYGYTISGWDIALEDGIDSDKDVFPSYKKVSDTFTVAVIGGTANVTAPQFEDKVIATADNADTFAAWVDESGNVVSVDATYKFFATQDIVLIAKSKSEMAVPSYFITVDKESQNISTSDTKYRLLVVANAYYDAARYTMVERGIVYTQVPNLSKNAFVIGGEGVKKAVSSATGIGQFMYSLNGAPKGSTITARAYMVLKDANGKFQTVYSDLCNATWNADDDTLHEDEGDF